MGVGLRIKEGMVDGKNINQLRMELEGRKEVRKENDNVNCEGRMEGSKVRKENRYH